MNILGVNTNAAASVCLMADGKILIAVQEERFSRIKNHGGFPELSLNYLCQHFPHIMKNLDSVAFSDEHCEFVTHTDLANQYHQRFENWDALPADFNPTLFQRISNKFTNPFQSKTGSEHPESRFRRYFKDQNMESPQYVYVKHHISHAAAAYHGLAKDWNKPYLVLTLDGGGDGESATVNIGEQGKLRTIVSTPSSVSVGHLYSNITYMLGCKPHEHEYKIMGLAPYVQDKYGKPVKDILSKFIFLSKDGLTFEKSTEEKTSWLGKTLKKELQFHRFDNIASGLQQFTEELLLQWVKNCIQHTGIRDLLLSGGVFMNVKVNKLIAEMDEVNSVNVFPSCGDESNCFGSAFYTYTNEAQKFPMFDVFTLGPNAGDDLEAAMKQYKDQCEFTKLDDPNYKVAELLSKGHIVARCSGGMEFGARALGSRSLLADPKNHEVVEQINFLIKQRDFWMPFAPAILIEDADQYIKVSHGTKDYISPYMMFAFDTTERYHDLIAAIHLADKTARAQMVNKEYYPDFHQILTHFRSITGRSVVLNTSFNLHGYPIVIGAMDSIDILLRTTLQYLVIEDWLITKKL